MSEVTPVGLCSHLAPLPFKFQPKVLYGPVGDGMVRRGHPTHAAKPKWCVQLSTTTDSTTKNERDIAARMWNGEKKTC